MNLLLAFIGVIGVSASGPLMAATQAPSLAIAFWRNALGTACLAPVALTARRSELGAVSRRDAYGAGFAGLMLAAHFATWVSSLKLTTVAAATALVTTQIVWVVLIDRFRGARVPVAVVAGLASAIFGVFVISGVDFALSRRALLGDLLAIAGGLFAALYLVAGADVRKRLSTTTYTFICYGVCSVILLAACLVLGQDLTGFAARDWALIVGVTVAAQLLGHSLFNHLLAVMSPTLISLFILLEVPGAALLAGLFLGQTPAPGVYLGLAMILAGLALVVLNRAPDEEEISGLD